MFKRVLVCCDVSEHASHAACSAAELAEHLKSEVLLLHVMPHACPESPYTVAWQMEVVHGETPPDGLTPRDSVMELLHGLFRRANVPCRVLYETGNPSETIVEVARREGVELIVLGSQGTRELTHLGAVADHVAHNAPCPVLIIP